MATIVVVREMQPGGHRAENEIEVEEDVATVAARVNAALTDNEKFVPVTGTDGKELTVLAAKVQDIHSA